MIRSLFGVVAIAASTTAFAGGSVSAVGKVQVTIANNLQESVCFLYISPTESPEWGPDQLGARTLLAGETDAYEMDMGSWDFKAEDCNNNVIWSESGKAVYANSKVDIGDPKLAPKMVDLTVVNLASSTICFLYVSPTTDSEWGGDVLESEVLPAGETKKYQVTQGSWDFKAEDCDNNVITLVSGVSVASASVLTITND